MTSQRVFEDPDSGDEFPLFPASVPGLAAERCPESRSSTWPPTSPTEPNPTPDHNAEEMALHLMTDRATVELELGTCFPQRNRPRVGVRASVQSQVRQTHTPREVCRFGPVGRLLTQRPSSRCSRWVTTEVGRRRIAAKSGCSHGVVV